MILTQFSADGFRNLQQVRLHPAPGVNLITGDNGAGKSSLLEAIQCLSVGHSFRTRRPRELIAHGASELLLTGETLDTASDQRHRCGLARRTDGSVELRLDYESQKSFQPVTRLLPIKALSPESHGLIQDSPGTRRQFIDWGVFHVEQGFLETWRAYRRSLSQRNEAIRRGQSDLEITTWDQILVESGERLDGWRRQYVAELSTEYTRMAKSLSVMFHVELTHRSGWAEGSGFGDALLSALEHSKRMKTTTVGPHRSELSIRSDGHLARVVLSRGQQKLLVYALELAQLSLLKRLMGQSAIVLCDDLQAELDEKHLDQIVTHLIDSRVQIFAASTGSTLLMSHADSMFHVERGRLKNAV